VPKQEPTFQVLGGDTDRLFLPHHLSSLLHQTSLEGLLVGEQEWVNPEVERSLPPLRSPGFYLLPSKPALRTGLSDRSSVTISSRLLGTS
jgi:hypothetical protein